MENSEIIVSDQSDSTQYMQIPIKKKEFGNFVTDLLGQQETISYRNTETFVASHDWLKHIHHLLDQRISQQANANLVDFSATFKYEKGPNRKITTVDGFLNFNEAKMVRTESIKIIWTYLVHFPNKDTPEKQEIELHLFTDGLDRKKESLLVKLFKGSVIKFTIEHTERTWGDDMHTLLEREVESIIEEDSPYKGVLTVVSIFLAIGFFILGIFMPDYIEGLIREKEIAKLYLDYIPNGQSLMTMDMQNKLNLVLRLLDPTNQLYKVSEAYKIISFTFGIFLATYTLFLFDISKSSFILITTKDTDAKEKYDNKHKKSTLLTVLSFISAIGAGVLGNYLYYYLNLN